MALFKKITAGNRKLSFLVVAGLVLAIFFAMYFLKYLPASKEELNNRGFRILRQISSNINEKNREYKSRINKLIKSPPSEEQKEMGLFDSSMNFKDASAIKNILLEKTASLGNDLKVKSVLKLDGEKLRDWTPSDDSVSATTISLEKDEQWKQQFNTKYRKSESGIEITMESNLDRFISAIINSRKDLFEHYMIMKDPHVVYTDKQSAQQNLKGLIYQSEGLGLTNVVDFDSLFTRSKDTHSYGIYTIDLSGTAYKLFMQPISWDENELVLIGLIKNSAYISKSLSVSTSVIYTVCIILLMLICSLPFVKVTLITPGEKLMVRDVVMTGVSLVLGTAVIVIILTDWFLFRSMERNNTKVLNELSQTVYDGFRKEISIAYTQLRSFDSAASRQDVFNNAQLRQQGGYPFLLNPQYYKNYDQVFWVSATGMQLAKWETNKKIFTIAGP